MGEEQKTRGERREERRWKKRQKMQQHGKGLAKTYRNAILNRLGRGRQNKPG